MSTIITNSLYDKVNAGLSKEENKKIFLNTIDRHMAHNSTIYAASGPGKRPVFTTEDNLSVIGSLGLDQDTLKATIKELQPVDNRLKIQGIDQHPFLLGVAVALRHASIKDDKKMIITGVSYITVYFYPLLHYKYFKKCEPIPTVMNYVVNNLSNKYKLKQFGNLWGAIYDITEGAYKLQRKNIEKGIDDGYVRFLTDARTRLNGFMRAISNVYYDAYNHGNYIGVEGESFDEDNYHEANSNTLEVEQITNRIITKLITVGPNKNLIKVAATSCNVSQTKLKSHIMTMITNKHVEDIRQIIENLLFMYLTSTEENHTINDVYTNDFTIYCLRVYKKSYTINKNVIEIKRILDRWLIELGVTKEGKTSSTYTNNYRKSLFMFFVMTVVDSK